MLRRTRGLSLVSVVLVVGCATLLSPNQRQQLETKVYEASYDDTFAACRDAFVNHGFIIDDSDHTGGIMAVSSQTRRHNPNTALALSIFLTPIGDFYMERYAWGIFDLILWPFSIVWAAPSNYFLARSRMTETEGTVAIQDLKPERTRVRITISSIEWDTKKYPALIHGLQEEIERQLFMKAGDTLDGEVQ